MAAFRGSNRAETPERITAWSFSRIKCFEQCPFKLKCSAIDKLKEPESPQMLEGKRVHKLSEDWLLGKLEAFPVELKFFTEDYQALKDCGPDLFVEHPLTFRKDLTLTKWFGADAWLRVRFDAFVLNDDQTAVVVDLKTGKQRKEDKEQTELFALAVFLALPDMQAVTSELWYSTTGNVLISEHTRAQLGVLKAKWFGKAERMMTETEFLPTPNGLCSWCHFRKSNQGPCKFG